mmetsp:Transcript_17264/g.44997  ORF Transcript_17264/g.44997 Transcript_17264/m.44997 type:complete len:833 (-) Transcript_17264:34-2532(-)
MLAARAVNQDMDVHGPSRLMLLQRNFQHRLAEERRRTLAALDSARKGVDAQHTLHTVRSYRRSGMPRRVSASNNHGHGVPGAAPDRSPFQRAVADRGSVRDMLARRRTGVAEESSRQPARSVASAKSTASTQGPRSNPTLPPLPLHGRSRSGASLGMHAATQTTPTPSRPGRGQRNSRYDGVRPISAATDKSDAPSPEPVVKAPPHRVAPLGAAPPIDNPHTVAIATPQNTGGARKPTKWEKAEAARKAKEEERRRVAEARKAKRDAIHAERKAEKARREAELQKEREAQEAEAEAVAAATGAAEKESAGYHEIDGTQSPYAESLLHPEAPTDVRSVVSINGRVVIDDERHVERLESGSRLSHRSVARSVDDYDTTDDVGGISPEVSPADLGSYDPDVSRFTEPDEYRPMSEGIESPPPQPQPAAPTAAERKKALKTLKVQTGVRKRARADLRIAYAELADQEDVVEAAIAGGTLDEYAIKKKVEILDEAKAMISHYVGKLGDASVALRTAVEAADAVGVETDAGYAAATAELEQAAPQPMAPRPPPAASLAPEEVAPVAPKPGPKPPSTPRGNKQGRRNMRKVKQAAPAPEVEAAEPGPESQSVAEAVAEHRAPAQPHHRSPSPAQIPRTTPLEAQSPPQITHAPPSPAAADVVSPPPVTMTTALPPGALSPDAQPSSAVVLKPCTICGRKFAADRLAKHENVCKKAATAAKKRKTFDVKKARIQGTEAAQFAGKSRDEAKYEAAKKRKNAWKAKSEAFRAAMRAAKDPNAGPPPPSDTSHLVPCEYCGRKFNEDAHARHIIRCKEQSSKPKVVPKGRKKAKYDPRSAMKK